MKNQRKLKIYMYKNRKIKNVFTIYGTQEQLFSILDKLYMQIERGNTDYIKVESAVFRKNDFAFAMIV